MKTAIENGTGAWPLETNIAVNVALGGDAWASGLRVIPNTTNTSGIFVDVEAGTIISDGDSVSIQSQSVKLPPATDNPYIAIITADTNGMGKVVGNEATFRPNDAQDGTTASFPNGWMPMPGDGSRVAGVARAIVFVDTTVSDSTDLTAADIENYDIDGVDAISESNLEAAIEAIDTSAEPIGTTVQSAATFGGASPADWRQQMQTVTMPGEEMRLYGSDNPDGPSSRRANIYVPGEYRFELYRVSAAGITTSLPTNVSAEVVRRGNVGPVEVYSSSNTFNESTDGSPIAVDPPTGVDHTLSFQLVNSETQGETTQLNAMFRFRLFKP